MNVRALNALRLPNRAIAFYFVAIALIGFAVDGGVYSVLLNLFLLRMGYGPTQIGLVNAAGMFTFALCSLPAGALGQRWGSRQAILLGLGLVFVGVVLLPLADTLPEPVRLPWLVLHQVVQNLGLALYFVNTAPYVMQLIDSGERNRIFPMQTALLSLAAFAGSLLGGFLPALIGATIGVPTEQPAPYRYGLILAGLALLPAMLALSSVGASPAGHATPADEPAPPSDAPAPRVGRLLTLMALVRLLQVVGLAAMSIFFNVYLDSALQVPTSQIGAIISVGRLLGVPAALATSVLTRQFGNRSVVFWTSLGTALSLLPIALVPHWAAAALSFIGVICLSWIRYSASIVYFLELVPPARRPLVSGVTEMAAGICFTLVTLGGGYAITLFGYRSLFLTGAALTFLGGVVFGLAFRRQPAGRTI